MSAGDLLVPAALLLAAALPAAAGEFRPPAGCETFLTVQSRGCEVSNFYRCSADPAGHQWRTDFGLNGREFTAQIDAEARWLQSLSHATGLHKLLEPGAPDPASFSTLMSSGYDDMEFWQTDNAGGRHHYKGYDRIVGDAVIDGVPLRRTEFDVTHRDGEGALVDRMTGGEYVHPELGRFLSGRYRVEFADGEVAAGDGTPVDFIFPGEPGFAATVPIYQCSDMVSSLDPSAEEFRHDQVR